MARETEQQKREKALLAAVARGKIQESVRRDIDLAAMLGMPQSSFSQHKRKGFQNMDFGKFCIMARKLRLTGREICAAVGVPYEDPKF